MLSFVNYIQGIKLPQTTKTLNPLPFEHLEPKRFEDLIRQLAYEFKNWRSLEATGRSGGDESYDIRGWEIIPGEQVDEEIEDNEEKTITNDIDRRWLIQCKREQRITPKKLESYFNDIPKDELSSLYGLVFAASCDLSKRSRDLLINNCREAGISECHIWTKAEIEDMLFQPKNDNLLFAYFGISLQIRKKSIKSQLRSKLAAKRKAISVLADGSHAHELVLIRDPEEDKYPYLEDNLSRNEHLWRLVYFKGHNPLGMVFETRDYMAYLSDDETKWDVANKHEYDQLVNDYIDPWHDDSTEHQELEKELELFHSKLKESERGAFKVEVIIPYEEIIDIDKYGDDMFNTDVPHIYMSFYNNEIPYIDVYAKIIIPAMYKEVDGRHVTTNEPRTKYLQSVKKGRVKKYPAKFRREF